MGVALRPLISSREIGIEELNMKHVAVDALNTLYQLLSTIRQRDGTPLMDSDGNVTSHLSGIFYRVTNLIDAGIRPIFIFDGKPPDFKAETLKNRERIRTEARAKWAEASTDEEAFRYAQASTKVDSTIISSAKELLGLMGVPYVEALSEGEAQAAFLVGRGDADMVASQDYDSLLFGSKILCRNLAATGKKKVWIKGVSFTTNLELIDLEEMLGDLGISRENLVEIAMLVGTDFNTGVKGIGPKTALKYVKKYDSFPDLLKAVDAEIENWEEIREFFLAPPTTSDYDSSFKKPDRDGISSFLVDMHDFSEARVSKTFDILQKQYAGRQKTLQDWF